MSALSTIIGSLSELSESELRQLYLVVGVRLGIPDVPTGAKPRGKAGGKTTNAKTSAAKGSKKSSADKGNPNRKSQWANHPLYQEYSRLKKVVETQAKESKLSFNAVSTTESRAYRVAFNQWLEAKSSFRGHGESGQDRVKPGQKEEESAEETDEEEGEEPSSSKQQPKAAAPPTKPEATGKSGASPPPKGAGKSSPPKGKGKSPAK